MKKQILIVIGLAIGALASVTACAAEDLSVENIVEVPGKTKDQIFTATKTWIAQSFVSGKAVIESEDKEAGRIIGNAAITFPCYSNSFVCFGKKNWKLNFNVRLDMKDNKFRATYTNLELFMPAIGSGFSQTDTIIPVEKDNMEDVTKGLSKLSDELKLSIEKEAEKSNW